MFYFKSMLCTIFLFFSSLVADAEFNWKQLFRPEFVSANGNQPDLDETYKVIQFLNENALEGVDFGSWELSPYFDTLGLDSSMALDFLSRYLNECTHLPEEDPALRVKRFEPYYKKKEPVFISRDYAFAQVASSDDSSNLEKIKYSKLQSIANYHHLILKPMTTSIKKKDIKTNKAKFERLVEDLPPSTYMIVALDPVSPDEPEDRHMMVLIKDSKSSIFYDQSLGALQIYEKSKDQVIKTGEFIKTFLIELPFPEFRIYEASCREEGCINLWNGLAIY